MMKNVSIKIPKGTKCKNGICEQDIELDTAIEIPELKPVLRVEPTPELNLEHESAPDTPPKQIKQEEKTKVEYVPPNYLPKYKCKNGNCGQAHNNPNYSEPVRGQCPNCKQFSPLASGKCYWCDEDVDELDQEELNDLGIPIPKNPGDHDHGI